MTYWSWSYKRKFIWNLGLIPIAIVVIVWGFYSVPKNVAIIQTLIISLIAITTQIYTYTKWKKEEIKG
ncbi:hypothetical protein [Bacillus sp. 1P02SD]|uniref:hypothetical protein n=1 Tax=Bacillus sp. 1P02SD TaxID=3132264 RepID=UPI00399FFBA5